MALGNAKKFVRMRKALFFHMENRFPSGFFHAAASAAGTAFPEAGPDCFYKMFLPIHCGFGADRI